MKSPTPLVLNQTKLQHVTKFDPLGIVGRQSWQITIIQAAKKFGIWTVTPH